MTDATRIAIAIVIAGAMIAFAVLGHSVPGRYVFRSSNGGLTWIDTVTGTITHCRETRCILIDRNGNRSRADAYPLDEGEEPQPE